jgi:hypothetical protein
MTWYDIILRLNLAIFRYWMKHSRQCSRSSVAPVHDVMSTIYSCVIAQLAGVNPLDLQQFQVDEKVSYIILADRGATKTRE